MKSPKRILTDPFVALPTQPEPDQRPTRNVIKSASPTAEEYFGKSKVPEGVHKEQVAGAAGGLTSWAPKKIAERILTLAEQLSGIKGFRFYRYQREFALRMILSVLKNDAAELTVLISRQAGKTQTICLVVVALMLILPTLATLFPEQLGLYSAGFWVGVFAPRDWQVQTNVDRISAVLSSQMTKEVMSDPDLGITVVRRLTLSNGSHILAHTASPQTYIESKTLHLLVVEECQDMDRTVLHKSLHPMLASTAGTMVKIGTANAKKCEFLEAIRRNKRRDASARAGWESRRHFEYDFKICQEYNPRYKRFIEEQKQLIGEESDAFRMSYCVAPETRILTSDLRHVPAGTLRQGDALLAFEEDRTARGRHREFRKSLVEAVGRITRPCYRLTFNDGTQVTCSTEHQWLQKSAGGRTIWKRTEDLIVGVDRVFKITDVWGSPQTYETGYLAAAFEGEGCFCNPFKGHMELAFAQKKNVMFQRVVELLQGLGYRYSVTSKGKGVNGNDFSTKIAGGRGAILKFLGEIRPQRLLDKLNPNTLGSIGRHDHKAQGFKHPKLVRKEYLGEREVIALRTSTRTYIAEGLASHNCLEWILERGMFTSPVDLDHLEDRTREAVVAMDGTLRPLLDRYVMLAGLDIGKSHDSTVLTLGLAYPDTGTSEGFQNIDVIGWFEFIGDDHESQFAQILPLLEEFRVNILAIDSTGMGDVHTDRYKAVLSRTVVLPVVFSTPTKSQLYKMLDREIRSKRISVPAGPNTRKTRTYKHFRQQMEDLEKEYRNSYLDCHAPKDDKNAHDDYPTSLALLINAAYSGTLPSVDQLSTSLSTSGGGVNWIMRG